MLNPAQQEIARDLVAAWPEPRYASAFMQDLERLVAAGAADFIFEWRDSFHGIKLLFISNVIVGRVYPYSAMDQSYKAACGLPLPPCFKFTPGSLQESKAQLEAVVRQWFASAGAVPAGRIDYRKLLLKYMRSVLDECGVAGFSKELVQGVTPEEAAALVVIEDQIKLGL